MRLLSFNKNGRGVESQKVKTFCLQIHVKRWAVLTFGSSPAQWSSHRFQRRGVFNSVPLADAVVMGRQLVQGFRLVCRCFWILFACNTISRPSKWPTSIIILLEKSFVFFFGGNLGRYLLGNASLQKRWVSFRNLCLKECLGVSAQDRFWGPQLHRAWLVAEVKVWTLETGIFPKTIWKELQETLISGGFPMG